MPSQPLADWAAQALEEADLTITEVADSMGVNYVTAWRITKGRSVRPNTLTAFATATGQDPTEPLRLLRSTRPASRPPHLDVPSWYPPPRQAEEADAARSYSTDFGAFVVQRRTTLGLSPDEFADRAGVTIQEVAQLEGGLIPPQDLIRAVAIRLEDDWAEWFQAAGYPTSPVDERAIMCPAPRADQEGPLTQIPLVGTVDQGTVTPFDEDATPQTIHVPAVKGEVMPDRALQIARAAMRDLKPGDFILLRPVADLDQLEPGDLVLGTPVTPRGPAGAGAPADAIGEFQEVTAEGIRLREYTARSSRDTFTVAHVSHVVTMRLTVMPASQRVDDSAPNPPRRQRKASRKRRAKAAA